MKRKILLTAGFVACGLALAVFAGLYYGRVSVERAPYPPAISALDKYIASQPPQPAANEPAYLIPEPILNARSRVSKKPFGIHVTPKDSPVSPERFTGYHTGVDFETTAEEQDKDVSVYAICAGKINVEKRASGYGGVLNQSCVLNGQDVTVTYGHLRLTSITKKTGEIFLAGERIGVLGKGYTTETDGERKHLHLGIHKGKSAVLTGYVAGKNELENWLNALDFLKSEL